MSFILRFRESKPRRWDPQTAQSVAGGGIKGGVDYGESDDFSYNVAENPAHLNDINATILRQCGIDHERLSYKFQGLDARLTGVEPHRPIAEIIA